MDGHIPNTRQDPSHSLTFEETPGARLFVMKDLAAVEEAVGQGAKIVGREVAF
jgi:hypothetical protein